MKIVIAMELKQNKSVVKVRNELFNYLDTIGKVYWMENIP